MSTRRRLGAGIVTSYLNLLAQIITLLVLTPFVIDREGASVYGSWAIVLSVVGYVRLLELGLGQTTARYVAAARTERDVNAVLASSIAALAVLALVGLVVAVLVAAVAPEVFGGVQGLGAAVLIASASAALQLPLFAFGQLLFGLERIAERNAFLTARALAGGLAVLIAVEAGADLVVFVAAAAVAEMSVMLAQAAWCRFRVAGLQLHPSLVSRAHLADMSRFSVAILGLGVATQLAFYSDGLVVGAALGAASVAVYTVAMRLVDGTSLLISQFADVFMPRFSKLASENRPEHTRAILLSGTRATLVLGYPAIAWLIGLGQALVAAWVGPGFEDAWTPLALLAGGLAFGMPLRFGLMWAIGSANHRRIAGYAIADSVANIVLSIALVGPLGIDGVALATFVALTVSNGYLMPRVIFPALQLPLWSSYWRPIAISAAIVAPAALVMRLWVSPAVEGSIAATALVSAVWLPLGALLLACVVLEPGERRAVRAAALRLRPRRQAVS